MMLWGRAGGGSAEPKGSINRVESSASPTFLRVPQIRAKCEYGYRGG